MTEEKFEEMIERSGEKFEIAVENAAQKLENTLEFTMQHRPARFIAKTLSYGGSIGFIIASMKLKEIDYPVMANICLITSCTALATNILVSCIVRKKDRVKSLWDL